jgi:hypothetical protein
MGQSVTETTTTDTDGNYVFSGLRPGTYSVQRGGSPAFANGHDDVGSLGGASQRLRIDEIVLGAGQQGQSYDFGQLIKPRSVLTTPEYRALLAQGPHPAGPGAASGRGHRSALPRHASSRILHWLPTLAEQIDRSR